MSYSLAGIKVAVLGGDARELELIPELVRLGGQVRVAGYPHRPELHGCTVYRDLRGAVAGADVVILPVPGVAQGGVLRASLIEEKHILDDAVAAAISMNTPVLVGVASPWLRHLADERGWRLIETADIDELAILNSIPTAEGAIELAMRELPITLHGSKSFVLGLGRTGFTLARSLAGLGSLVTIFDRGAEDRARAYCQGWQALEFGQLPDLLPEAELVFNTVPKLILTAELLTLTRPECLVIDLASSPGGTDFAAAQALGRKAILAPGLPGKVAPKTAGAILARIYPRLILEHLERPGVKAGGGL